MKVNEANLNAFAKEFETKIFPTIKGADGKGIERLRTMVEIKRASVRKRRTVLDTKGRIDNEL